jgi:hypothetical protein
MTTLVNEGLGVGLPGPVHRAVKKRLLCAADAGKGAYGLVLVIDTFKSKCGPALCAELYDISVSEGSLVVPFSIA